MKEDQIDSPLEKSTLKKPNLIRVNSIDLDRKS